MDSVALREITALTKDGEWGKGEPFASSIETSAIRGTDFEDVRVGLLDRVPSRYISEHIAMRKRLQAFDILLETAGGSKDRPTGRTMFVKPSLISKSPLPLICASFARFIRIDRLKANPEYIFWLLQHLYSGGALLQYHTQHTGVARFQFTTFAEREPLPLPAIATQNCIASILSAYDDLIENNTRRIKILEEMAQMLYREWFVHFRFPGHEKVRMVESELGPIPEGWTAPTLQALLEHSIGGGWGEEAESNQSSVPAYVIRGTDIPGARYGEVANCPLRWHKESNHRSRRLESGDLVFEVSGGSKGQPVGRSLLIGEILLSQFDRSVICASFCKLLRPRTQSGLSAALYLFLREAYTNGVIERFQVQSTGISNFKFTAFIEEIRMALPDSRTLARFAEVVCPMLEAIAVFGKRNAILRTTRDLLLPKLISGEIPVEAAEETAIELMEQTT
ncbi:MAG: restriction endonuclease subunit S [Bryobacterales bacterium]|nr:restriction endonuclease subunit S [Bryobacterales bacterium]